MSFEKSVFINCPFDKNYRDDLLKPILYVTVINGLIPRLALEISDAGQIRLEKIISLIKSCKFSIHDLSLVKSTEAEQFSRMNMPFELGIDCGLRNSENLLFNGKQFLILEANRYDYMKALSDINGFDVKVHNNDTERVVVCLYNWLSEILIIKKQDPPKKIFYNFLDFNTSLFIEKLGQFGTDELAINYIENISIPEYIDEIRERLG